MQAGILEGQVSDVMVLDVWQASLMRAFAKQRLKQDGHLAAAAGVDPDQLEDSSDDEVRCHAMHRCWNIPNMSVPCPQETASKALHDTGDVHGLLLCKSRCDCCSVKQLCAGRQQGLPQNWLYALLTCVFTSTLVDVPVEVQTVDQVWCR